MKSQVRLSVVTPTRNREPMLMRAYDHFCAQTLPDIEWLIFDDSEHPSAFFTSLADPRVTYVHQTERISIGEKRNKLISIAQGELIAHFDDDDYYAPNYLETMAAHLEHHDFVKLSAWYVYSEPHDMWGYCDPGRPAPISYHIKPTGEVTELEAFIPDITMFWGYGFSYVYRRAVWQAFPFEPLSFGEDHTLVVSKLLSSKFRLHHFADMEGIVVHVLHSRNSSDAFPQRRLAPHELPAPLLRLPLSLNPNLNLIPSS